MKQRNCLISHLNNYRRLCWLPVYIVLGCSFLLYGTYVSAQHTSHEIHVHDTKIITPHDVIPRFCGPNRRTHTAVQSGAWSNPATWGGSIPTTGARVHIPMHKSVLYNTNSDTRIDCIEVEGKLHWATTVNTKLVLNDLQVLPHGTLEIGTIQSPISASAVAKIIIQDTALQTGTVESPGIDPYQWGQGIVAFGTWHMSGTPLGKSFIRVSKEPLAGDTSLTLLDTPDGWRIGDEILIPDTNPGEPGGGEIRSITGINGKVLSFAEPLTSNHKGAYNDDGTSLIIPWTNERVLPHAVNLTRNVSIESENPQGTRGHTAFVFRANIDVRYATFRELGRTTTRGLNSTKADKDGTITHIGTNQIARYPLHAHHLIGPVNPTNTGYQYKIIGNSVRGGLKWAIAIHSAHYGLIQDNVATEINGAGIVTEDANETENDFVRNFVGNQRKGPAYTTAKVGDFQILVNSGYWLQGPKSRMIGNVAANYMVGLAPYMQFVPRGGRRETVHIPECRGCLPGKMINFRKEPFLEFSGNETYANRMNGLAYRFIQLRDTNVRSTIYRNTTIWRSAPGDRLVFGYANRQSVFDGLIAHEQLGNKLAGNRFGFRELRPTFQNAIHNANIQGTRTGIVVPRSGASPSNGVANTFVVTNTTISSLEVGIAINPWIVNDEDGSQPLTVSLNNVAVQKSAFGDYRSKKYLGSIVYSPAIRRSQGIPVSAPTARLRIIVRDWQQQPGNNFLIFHNDQAPEQLMPHASKPNQGCPEENLTNQQCWVKYSIATLGQVAPCISVDGDPTCAAAATRATAQGLDGMLVFPFQGDEPPAPETPEPRIVVSNPRSNTTIQSDSLDVQYSISGRNGTVSGMKVQLDSGSVIEESDMDGRVIITGITTGSHVLQLWLVDSDGREIKNTRTTIPFSKQDALIRPNPPTNLRIS